MCFMVITDKVQGAQTAYTADCRITGICSCDAAFAAAYKCESTLLFCTRRYCLAVQRLHWEHVAQATAETVQEASAAFCAHCAEVRLLDLWFLSFRQAQLCYSILQCCISFPALGSCSLLQADNI